MNELQKVEYSLLRNFISVCDRLGLAYYLVCGTALGAVKYGGFIPWDDDVDVALTRADYNIFCEKAQQLLPDYIFLQNYKTDSAFPSLYTKLRDSRTTFIEESAKSLPINHGVYIDVFPLDGYPENKKAITRFEKKKKKYKLQLSCSFSYTNRQSIKAKLFLTAERLLGYHKRTQSTVEKLEKLLLSCSAETSRFLCNHGNWQGKLEYAPREQYGQGVFMKFEGLDVRVPEKYDEYLTQKYGDWRADLPKEQQVGHHYYSIMDLNKPYTEYFTKKK